MNQKIGKISNYNEKLISDNTKLQTDLIFYKEGYLKFVDIFIAWSVNKF